MGTGRPSAPTTQSPASRHASRSRNAVGMTCHLVIRQMRPARPAHPPAVLVERDLGKTIGCALVLSRCPPEGRFRIFGKFGIIMHQHNAVWHWACPFRRPRCGRASGIFEELKLSSELP